MICCLNPDCDCPINREGDSHCHNCQERLKPLLRNHYKILNPLGRGGFGKTYLAEDNDKLKELCVVKQLAFNRSGILALKKAKDLFFLEAQQLQRLGQNPQIPSLLAYFEEDDYLYLVQQYIKGQNLAERLQQKRIYNECEIRDFLGDILPVFKFIHDRGVIHRDVKLSNIMYSIDDSKYIPIDFGVSKVIDISVGNTLGTSIGSQGYAAPEQLEGKAYPASDLYSLGVCCFCLLSGINSPFKLWTEFGYGWTKNWQKFVKIPLSADSIQIFNKLLDKDVTGRYQTANSILEDLKQPSKSSCITIIDSCTEEISLDLEEKTWTNLPEIAPSSPKIETPTQKTQQTIAINSDSDFKKMRSPLSGIDWFGVILFAALSFTLFSVHHLSNSKTSQKVSSIVQPKFSEIEGIPTGLFNYGGSTTWASIRAKLYPKIQATWPDYQLRYLDPINGNPGSNRGIKMLLEDQLSFTFSSRPLKDEEYQQATIHGHHLRQIPVAIDAIAIAVHPHLSVKGLTIAELSDIYTGKITNWQEVGGPDLAIAPYSRHFNEGGMVDFFMKNVLRNKSFGENVVKVPNTTTGIRKVAANPGAIYYDSASQIVFQCQVKSLAIGRDRSSLVTPYLEPLLPPAQCNANQRNWLNRSAFLSGEYPITRRLFLIFKESDRPDSLAAKAYIQILFSDKGQRLINEAGFIAINYR